MVDELSESSPNPPRKWGRRVRWALGAALIFCALAAGWGLASAFQSPDQREANASAPSPRPVLAAVTSGTLDTSKIYAGQVATAAQIPITFKAQADATTAVVTSKPLEVGTTLNGGDVVTEINGRPVFVLASPFALYRDLARGDKGPDVLSLQKTLVARGYQLAADGTFGAATESAVRDLYRQGGYSLPVRAASSASGGDVNTAKEGDSSTPDAAEASTATPYVPVSEMLGLASLPTTVISGMAVGHRVGVDGASDAVLGSAEKVVSVATDAAGLSEITEGTVVSVSINDQTINGRVTSVTPPSSTSGTPTAGGTQAPGSSDAASSVSASFVVTTDESIAGQTAGVPARVTVSRPVATQVSLLLPSISVTDRGGDNQVVLVSQPDGSFKEVAVTVLDSVDGQAAVLPDQDGQLRAGDEVRVG